MVSWTIGSETCKVAWLSNDVLASYTWNTGQSLVFLYSLHDANASPRCFQLPSWNVTLHYWSLIPFSSQDVWLALVVANTDGQRESLLYNVHTRTPLHSSQFQKFLRDYDATFSELCECGAAPGAHHISPLVRNQANFKKNTIDPSAQITSVLLRRQLVDSVVHYPGKDLDETRWIVGHDGRRVLRLPKLGDWARFQIHSDKVTIFYGRTDDQKPQSLCLKLAHAV